MRKTPSNRPTTKAEKATGARPGVPAEFTQSARGVRLQKAMAEAGLAARRVCEELIEAGRVTVNGQGVSALPAWVDPERDIIAVDGRPLPRKKVSRGANLASPYEKVVIALHKPARVVTTTEDPEGRRTVLDLIDAKFSQRLFPVGRLDFESTGLILLTNDGELAQRLTHPSYGVAKQYLVTVRGRVEPEALERLRKGIFLATPASIALSKAGGGHAAAAEGGEVVVRKTKLEKIEILRHDSGGGSRGAEREDGERVDKDSTVLSITLEEGQNREIRRMMASLGYQVRKLKRVSIGPVRLKGLSVGAWRVLTGVELRKLRAEVNL